MTKTQSRILRRLFLDEEIVHARNLEKNAHIISNLAEGDKEQSDKRDLELKCLICLHINKERPGITTLVDKNKASASCFREDPLLARGNSQQCLTPKFYTIQDAKNCINDAIPRVFREYCLQSRAKF